LLLRGTKAHDRCEAGEAEAVAEPRLTARNSPHAFGRAFLGPEGGPFAAPPHLVARWEIGLYEADML
jgi:hypothetical protein